MFHMVNRQVKKIVILGGGTAGWMAAAALSERYRTRALDIELIESDQIATVGVGEATVPGIVRLHQGLGIGEREFIRATGATFKLGIEFRDWHEKGHGFFHPFAGYGVPIGGREFYQCWLKLYMEGVRYDLEDFCLAIALAKNNRFAQPDADTATELARYSYAYHFDAGRYAQFLRRYAEARQVKRTEGKLGGVLINPNGEIAELVLEDGQRIGGDLFIDCSGFRALLIEGQLNTGFDDWSRWLPCDRAVALQTNATLAPEPYTRSSAMEAGWRWRIPLRHRTGNGYVYCSRYLEDKSAQAALLAGIDGQPAGEPRLITFTAGMRRLFWNKNCVALGLASGFIEPLESTSISLIQTGVEKLMQFMPELRYDRNDVDEANRLNRMEYERIRDFIILHYKLSRRRDSDFWRYVGEMPIPASLEEKIEAFSKDGSILLGEQESFSEQSWIAMYNGFKRVPVRCKPAVRDLASGQLEIVMDKMRSAIRKAVDYAPRHEAFLETTYQPKTEQAQVI